MASRLETKNNVKVQRVFISGATPYADNRGIAALIRGTLEFLKSTHRQKTIVYVWHTFPGSYERYYLEKATTKYTFKDSGIDIYIKVIPVAEPYKHLMTYVKHVVDLYRLILATLLFRFLNIIHIEIEPRIPVLRELFTADIVIELNFGDIFTDVLYGSIEWFFSVLRFILFKISGKNIYVLSQSLGPFKSITSRAITLFLLRDVKVLGVREPLSYLYAVRLGIDKNKIRLMPDMGFLTPVVSTKYALNILRKEGLSRKNNGPLIGIFLNTHLFSYIISKKHKRIRFLYELINMIEYLTEKLNATVILIPHYTLLHKGFDCRAFNILVKNILKTKNNVIVITGEYTVEELWGVLKTLDIVISFMTHPVIGSLRVGVPVIAVAYTHKTWGIMKMFGLEQYVIHYGEFNSNILVKNVADILKRKKYIKEYIEKRKANIYKLFHKLREDIFGQK